MRTELLRECFFVVTAVDCDSPKSHLSSVLNTEMAQAADTVNRDEVSCASTGVAQRVVNRNAGTHEWSGFFCWNFIRNRRNRIRRRDHVLRVTSIEVDACNFAIDAHREVSATTLFAHEAVT